MLYTSEIGTIYYTKVGTGPHLCFLHGFCEHQEIWQEQVEELSKHYSCLLIDLAGFGLSSLNGNVSIAQQAIVLNQLLIHLSIDHCTLFGHSMGGYIATEMLHQDASLFNGLGLIHSTALEDHEEKKNNRLKVVEFVKDRGSEPFLKQFYSQLVAPANLPQLEERLWKHVKATTEDSIINASIAMMNRSDHLDTLSQTSIPILFLCGTEDQHFPISDVYQQVAQCELGQLEIIENVGHLSMLESSEKCTEILLDFIQFVELV